MLALGEAFWEYVPLGYFEEFHIQVYKWQLTLESQPIKAY